MKSHTSEFKEEIKTLGKQQSVRITYKENNVTKTLTDEDINSVTPNYEASLLKSVMKALELDSNISIPKNTEIKFEYGLLVNGAYEYLDYGNYIVAKEPEKQEDTLSYKITCYDKMLYSMKDYEHIDISYPCTIKQYLVALCNKIGLQFKDSDFANANRQITNELFMTINEDGTYSSMGYTYRDVLDQIAETTGGCICMTLDDKVEVRYINKTINYETSKKSTNIEFESSVKEIVKIKELDGKSTQATRSGKNLYSSVLNSSSNVTINNLDLIFDFSKNIDSYARLTFKKEVGKTYTFVFDGSGMADGESVTFYLEQSTQTFNFKNGKNVWTQSAINENSYFTLDDRDRSNISSSITLSNIMILEGEYTEETIPEYEPYGASPSPEFPSEIKSVGDEGTVTIEQRGKNLFDASKIANTSIEVLDNGKTIKMPIATSGNGYTHVGTNLKGVCPKLKVGDTVYLLGDTTSQKNKFIYLGGNSKFTWEFGKSRTLTKNDLNAAFVLYGNNFEKGETEQVTISNLRIVKNASDKWEQYFNNTYTIPLSEPLRSLPNGTKDTIEEDGIHRRVGSVVLDGTEDWKLRNTNSTTGVSTYSLTDVLSYYKNSLNVKALSNYFNYLGTVAAAADMYQKEVGVALYYNTTVAMSTIIYINSNISNLNEFKTWLSTHNTEVQYELSEEVVEPFTEEQLEVINSMVTEKGTNIFELESNAILNYPVNYDTINEEYINDTNVNFGEKYRTY